MGVIHYSVDIELVKALQAVLPLRVFLETGTFRGDTAASVVPSFARIFTVEVSAPLHAEARARLAPFPNVSALPGDSPDVIRNLRGELSKESVLYWLDAHWGGDPTGGKQRECPLLAELQAIEALNEDSVILIDDARLFLAPPPAPHDSDHWPLLDEVVAGLRELSSRHRLWMFNDVFVFAPQRVRKDIVAFARARGVDLQQLVQVAKAFEPRAVSPSRDAAAGARFNAQFLEGDRSERIFAHHLQRLGIERVMDIGSNTGQFAAKLRRYGFAGPIYSVEPQATAHAQLVVNSRADANWFPLPRQGAGATPHFTTLNISENGWSSSLREVHSNHVRAEPTTRIVGSEHVYINKSSRLLRSALMLEIEGLKIDVQGYEDEVISGYAPFLENVRLLLLELSAVECYKGGPDMFSLERRLIQEFGFTRVSLEPSYYDDVSGVVQQFDGIYFRPNGAKNAACPASGLKVGSIITSVGGSIERHGPDGANLGPDWLQACAQSWRLISPHLVSVAECENRLGVRWVKSDARPSLAEIIGAADSDPTQHVLLTNADILFTPEFRALVPNLDPQAVYYGQRFDVELEREAPVSLKVKGLMQWGFDFFLLPGTFVRMLADEKLIPPRFCIGEPWWDYALPLLAMARGFPLKRLPLKVPLALHYAHAMRYSRETWLRNGAYFIELLKTQLSDPNSHAAGFVSAFPQEEGDLEMTLERFSQYVCQSLP